MAPGRYRGDDFEFRRKSQRVFVDRPTSDVILRLHATDIVRVRPNGDVILSTGGWATHKTMYSMNDALELFDMVVECDVGAPNTGRWRVVDSDGSVHLYYNDKDNFTKTIRSKGGDDRQRAMALATAYDVPYNANTVPPRVAPAAGGAGTSAAAAGPRVAPAPQTSPQARPATVLHAPPAPKGRAAANGAPAAAAVAAGARGGGSWANVAASRNSAAASSGAHTARMTGPGVSSAPAANRAAPAATGPGAAAAQWRAGPPGFSPAASTGSAGSAGAAAAAAAAAAAPSRSPPVGVQLEQQMKQLGIDAHELEDEHLCVVCMEDRRTIVLVPCGHMALCKDCCNTIVVEQKGNCPMCCQPVEYHVEVEENQP